MRCGSLLCAVYVFAIAQGCVFREQAQLVPGSGRTYAITGSDGKPIDSGLLILNYYFRSGNSKFASYRISNGSVNVPAIISVHVANTVMVLPPWLPIKRYEYPCKTYVYGMAAGEYPRPGWGPSSHSQIIEDNTDRPVSLRFDRYEMNEELENLEAIMRDVALERGNEAEQEKQMREVILQMARQRYTLLLTVPKKSGN